MADGLVVVGGAVVSGGPAPDPYTALNGGLTQAQLRALRVRNTDAAPNILGRYTGPAYPFGPTWASTFGPKTDLGVIFTNVCNILTTPIGSIPYLPFAGSEVPNLVFEINDSVTQGLIRYYVKRDLRRQEPRAKVLTVNTVTLEDDPHRIIVTTAFQIVGDRNTCDF